MQIQLVNQQDDYTCGVACAAMVAGITFEEALKECPEPGHGLHLKDLDALLTRLGVKYKRLMYPELCRTEPHIATVASLNVQGGMHYVVLDVTNAVLEIYDPQRGRPGKLWYASGLKDPSGVQLKSFAEVCRIDTD